MFSYGIKEKRVIIRFCKFKTAVTVVIMKEYFAQRNCYESEASAMLIIAHKHIYTSELNMQILKHKHKYTNI